MKSIFINNKWQEADGEAFVSKSPNDNEIVFSGNFASKSNCNKAVAAAKTAQEKWFELGLEKRLEYIRKFVEIVKENREDLSKTISDRKSVV